MNRRIIDSLLFVTIILGISSCEPPVFEGDPAGIFKEVPLRIVDSEGAPLYSDKWINNDCFHLDYSSGDTTNTAFLIPKERLKNLSYDNFKPIYLIREGYVDACIYLYAPFNKEVVYNLVLHIDNSEYQLKIRCIFPCYSSTPISVTLDESEVEIPVLITVPTT